jgi:hypothetical protein
MSTHRLCAKCNKNFAVIGQDYCPVHGGVVPKTIKEYEELRDSKSITGAQFYTSPGVPAFTEQTDSDRLSKLREYISNRLSGLSMNPHYIDEYDEGWVTGVSDSYREILRIIDSMYPNL